MIDSNFLLGLLCGLAVGAGIAVAIKSFNYSEYATRYMDPNYMFGILAVFVLFGCSIGSLYFGGITMCFAALWNHHSITNTDIFSPIVTLDITVILGWWTLMLRTRFKDKKLFAKMCIEL